MRLEAANAVAKSAPVSAQRLPHPGVEALRSIVTDDVSPTPLFTEQELLEGPLRNLTGSPPSATRVTPLPMSPKCWADYPVKPALVKPMVMLDEDIKMRELGERAERREVQSLAHAPPVVSGTLDAPVAGIDGRACEHVSWTAATEGANVQPHMAVAFSAPQVACNEN